MKASYLLWLIVPFGSQLVASQVNLLSIIVSEAESVATLVNSVLSSAVSAVSVAANSPTQTTSAQTTSDTASDAIQGVSSTSFSSSSSDSSTSSSQTTSAPVFGSINSSSGSSFVTTSRSSSNSQSSSTGGSSGITSSSTLSTPVVGTSSVVGATAETASSLPVSTSGLKHHSDLAIILGCVLGALALGFFILALVLCCKRRRRNLSPRHSALAVTDDEVDGWRGHHVAASAAAGAVVGHGSSRHARGASVTAPLMTEHPAYRNGAAPENPFVPVPPPPRRSAPNSRPGWTDDVAAAEAAPLAKETAASSHDHSGNGHHHGIAAGLAAAAVGAGVMHAHDKHKHKREDDDATLINDKPVSDVGVRRQLSRKPVPVNTINNNNARPYDPVSPVEPNAETMALTGASGRPSGENRRRSFSHDANRANEAFNQEYAPQSGIKEDHHHHGVGAGVAGLAAGAVGGAAPAHHHDRDRRRSRSSSSSNSNRLSRPAAAAATGSDSDHSSSSRNSRGSRNYTDAVPVQPSAHNAQQDLYGVPVVPASHSRSHGAAIPAATIAGLGAGAGAGAIFAHAHRPTAPSPLSSEVRHDHGGGGYSLPSNRSRRSSSLPRSSFPYDPTTSHDYGAYPAFPSQSHQYQHQAGVEAFPSLVPLPHQQPMVGPSPATTDKAIVGDNGYPHLGVPRRKSGGEYDFRTTGALGPQTMPHDVEPSTRPTSRHSSLAAKDDATWRLSDGMPGGWQRASVEGTGGGGSPRNSREWNGGNRDSGVGMNAGRRRLRASDFGGEGRGDDGYGQAM